MPHISQVNYDETISIAKSIHTDGDDLIQLHSHTRQRVHALRGEWVGDAADAFFEEMEGELLPALQRVAGALFLGEEILNKIMKIIHEADEETAQYFKNDLNGDFGAGLFGSAVGGVLGGTVGADDFGASKFGEALSPDGGDQTGQGDLSQPGSVPDTSTPPPAAQYLEMQPPSSDTSATETPATETPPAETPAAGGGGGGGGGGDSSQGMQGDLKGLGTGVGGASQQVGVVSGGPSGMPDHVYEGASGGSSGAGPSQPGPAGGSVGTQEQSSGGVAGAVGAAGILGAAAAGAAKVLKTDDNEPGE